MRAPSQPDSDRRPYLQFMGYMAALAGDAQLYPLIAELLSQTPEVNFGHLQRVGQSTDKVFHFVVDLWIGLRQQKLSFLQMFVKINGETIGKDGFLVLPKLLHPRSIGSIRLRSQNPFESPSIDPQYLQDPEDMEILLDGLCDATLVFVVERTKQAGTKNSSMELAVI